ncbi:GDSL esterase/lipase At5g03610-like [Cryptomeria japonica]|uniref:GDSL esterase/lipase At5g03610-like n=1 Tax=Cryptomeria japonica TaxID=3369 RepID=UPI0027DA9609|nr:GDSL esterase/lipase At5g03610-like [Cryptomeria japonica]
MQRAAVGGPMRDIMRELSLRVMEAEYYRCHYEDAVPREHKVQSFTQSTLSLSRETGSWSESRGRGNAEKARALFVFGDSYADTGNKHPYNPEHHTGFKQPLSYNYVSLICAGDILGLPVPIAYELLISHDCKAIAKKIRQGVNFAVGGSGIFEDYGFKTIEQQVKQFKKLIGGNQGFDSHKLSRSVVLISVAGNDYLAFLASRNGSIEGLKDLAKPVVSGTIDAVKQLYKGGLRNFAVSNIGPFGCAPKIDKTSCHSNYGEISALHTKLLREGVEILKSDLKELSIIISDLMSAVNHIFASPAPQFGFVDLFVPCCAAKGRVDMCGEVDQVGRALYEVCTNVDEKFYWDAGHPTQRGWHAIMWVYGNGAKEENKTISFIEGAPNVIDWVESLGFVAYNISTMFSPK